MIPEWIWILLLMGGSTVASRGSTCRNDVKCNCINIISSGNLEFQCPPFSSESNKTIIHIYGPSRRMRIDCDRIQMLNNSLLPDGNFSFVKRLELQECPLPKNGFTEIIYQFSLNSLEFLRFSEHPVDRILSSEDFKGLGSVKTLELKKNNLSTLDGNIFVDTPNLTDLMVDENKLILQSDTFKNVPNLSVLSLNSNEIEEIPKKTFLELKKLEKLFLWQNNLKALKEGVFEGLVNLKMLELSLNNIETIEDGVFAHTKLLTKVSLRRNRLQRLSQRIFKHCRLIELINVDENHNINLEDDVFSNFTNLKTINLAYNGLKKISEIIFQGSIKIEKITLNNNLLKEIPKNLLQTLINLKELHLQSNQIENIAPETFSASENLEYLYLQHNQLEDLNEKLLENLKNLKVINLSHNRIIRLSTQFLSRNKRLVTFRMSHNQFDFEEPTILSYNTPFSSFSSTNLKEVDLSYNNITRYPYDLNGIATIEEIKLQHNRIGEIIMNSLSTMNAKPLSIDLRSNNISTIRFIDFIDTGDDYERFRVDIEVSNNPIICDCNSYDLARYMRENDHPIRDYLVLNYNQMKCAGPPRLTGLDLEKVELRELTCHVDNNCTSSESCGCIWRPSDGTLVVDCSRKGLREVPEIGDLSSYGGYRGVEVHLEENLLERCPLEVDGYQNTSGWFLRGNFIRNVTWIPESLKVLDLTENRLETVDAKTVELLNGSRLNNLFMGGNPWKCDCEMKDFLKYLRDHIIQIDMSEIRCNATQNRLVDLSDADLCFTGAETILVVTVVVLLCLFSLTSAMSYYLLHKTEILIWLNGRGCCTWLVKEDELDEGKIYDAFVSFSHKDEDFVIENIVSVLESGRDPYRLCIHFRDWIPGEMIQSQIISSVNDSRRTIVVLSANFLESVWGIVEFKTAHHEAMREGRARVILIICGDIDVETLDEDLKAYMKTNTYIKWGDPWFWDKLKYALPKRTSRRGLSTKHANMMQYIEDKFKLMDKQPIHSVSTPVILSPKGLEEPLTCIA